MFLSKRKYKRDLEKLIQKGIVLHISIKGECGFQNNDLLSQSTTLNFREKYQGWYSEALEVIKQIIPDREKDFRELYKKPVNKEEEIDDRYTIYHYLHNIPVISGIYSVEPKVAMYKFEQQLAILKSTQQKFKSSLFNIKQKKSIKSLMKKLLFYLERLLQIIISIWSWIRKILWG